MGGFEALANFGEEMFRFFTRAGGYGMLVWLLSLVFAWSGLVKLRQPTRAAIAIVDFGVGRRVLPVLGFLVGAFEAALALALALSLVFTGLSRTSLLAGASLLWLFTLFIARSLLSRKQFACFCFGDTDSYLSGWTLARTTTLAVLATVLYAAGSPTATATAGNFLESYVLQATGALALLGVAVLASHVPGLLKWDSARLGFNTPDLVE